MGRVAVLIPYRGGYEHRRRALEWVLARYREKHPSWEVRVEEAPPGPWIKALPVHRGLRTVDVGIVAICDADVWTDGLAEAVEAVERGAPWAIPHLRVHRLTEQATAAVLGGAQPRSQPVERSPYMGARGGGIVVAKREKLLAVPMDPRYEGWGQDDTSWGHALNCLLGAPWRGSEPLYHLFHPPQRRLDRKWGSRESWALYHRYLRASKNPEAMKTLIKESHDALNAADSSLHDRQAFHVG